MTVSANTPRADYIGNGSMTRYSIPFVLFAATDLVVHVGGELKVLGVHYSVEGVLPGDAATTNCVFLPRYIPGKGAHIILEGNAPIMQPVDLGAGERFYEDTVERMVDRNTVLIKQLNARALKLSLGSETSPGESGLEFPEPDPGGYIRYKTDGTGLETVVNVDADTLDGLHAADLALAAHNHNHGMLAGLADDGHPQYIRHSLASAANDFLVASGAGRFARKTPAQVRSILNVESGGAGSGSVQTVNGIAPTDGTADVLVTRFVTQEEYNDLLSRGLLVPGSRYVITDAEAEFYIPPAGPAAETEDGTPGLAVYAAGDDTTSLDKAATPAGVTAQIAEAVRGSGLPLLSLIWSTVGTPELGYLDISQDNGLLPRGAFPDAWAKIAASGVAISDSAWTAERTANSGVCGKFSTGDGSTTFRVPLIGKRFVRATGDDLDVGTPQGDAIRNIDGEFAPGTSTGFTAAAVKTGPFKTGSLTFLNLINAVSGSAANIAFDASRVVPTAEENRPVSVAYIPLLKMYGAITDAGDANVAALIQATAGKLDTSSFNQFKSVNTTVIETWRSGDSWYRKYSDGWVEQGGNLFIGTGEVGFTCNLHTPMTTTNYTVQIFQLGAADQAFLFGIRKTTSWTMIIKHGYSTGFFWTVFGK